MKSMSKAPSENSAKVSAPTGNRFTRFLRILGPGLVTGAADDDPSGIATYSIAGAQHGLGLLWTALLTWPLMGAVQMMCARIGMVTGMGLAGALRKKVPKPLLVTASFALFAANTINIGADLAGMGDAMEMFTGINSHYWVLPFGVAIAVATIRFRYDAIANILKWLALVLFAYVITGFIVKPDWGLVARHTFLPTFPKDHDAWGTLVALLGTTISPYLFFWQSSQEVEEEKSHGKKKLAQRRGASHRHIEDRKWDVGVGTLVSNAVMFFIILTTALTLHKSGHTHVETSRQAAEALRPLAGNFAAILFTVGLVGVGFLAVPTLAGSAAYAFAETFGWRQGLDEQFPRARAFYVAIITAVALGVVLDLLNVSAMQALYWSAVVNGILAPFLLVGILLVARDKELMQGQPSSRLSMVVVTVTTVLMFGAAIGMFVF
jgi:NRAMP (natural resistance-associated macrophage protein)-like metal ion transporter